MNDLKELEELRRELDTLPELKPVEETSGAVVTPVTPPAP